MDLWSKLISWLTATSQAPAGHANCSFCDQNYRDVGPLVEGPSDSFICRSCVECGQSWHEEAGPSAEPKACCVFYRRPSKTVGPLFEGRSGCGIRKACVDLAQSILDCERQRRETATATKPANKRAPAAE
ncbi:MAG: hypothetical protein B7Z73_02490 [Planctomycetia bacterium 21-64-5]|nr:MAG: hypothetical protein B7Z73_02490 [Planctomycetia bacterium 21-64-5]HQU41640.1 ClpX C4-type zinc finger protein [Pirellulales bacterium]